MGLEEGRGWLGIYGGPDGEGGGDYQLVDQVTPASSLSLFEIFLGQFFVFHQFVGHVISKHLILTVQPMQKLLWTVMRAQTLYLKS